MRVSQCVLLGFLKLLNVLERLLVCRSHNCVQTLLHDRFLGCELLVLLKTDGLRLIRHRPDVFSQLAGEIVHSRQDLQPLAVHISVEHRFEDVVNALEARHSQLLVPLARFLVARRRHRRVLRVLLEVEQLMLVNLLRVGALARLDLCRQAVWLVNGAASVATTWVRAARLTRE